MGIKSNNGYVYFNEILYRCMRHKFGNMRLNRQMQIFELRTQYNIFLTTQEVQKRMDKKAGAAAVDQRDAIYNEMIQKSTGFNPFLTEMNYKIAFRTWLKFAKQRIQMEAHGDSHRRKSFNLNIQRGLI